MKKQKNGISLIVLVITIIVIIILAVAVILSIANNNPIENANKAKFQNDLKSIQEELELVKSSNYTENKGESYNNNDGSEISLNNLSAAQKYQGKLVVNEGELKYLASQLSTDEVSWAEELGIKAGGVVLEDEDMNIVDGILHGYDVDPKLSDIIIPNKFKSIGESAFSGNPDLKSVVISEGIESIGDSAFSGCGNLKSVVISEGIKSIGNSAFLGCVNLESVTIPSTVETMGNGSGQGVFENCTALKNVTIAEGVKSIGVAATFAGCTSLRSITIPSTVEYISSGMFENCTSLKNVTISNGLKYIDDSLVFGGCTSLESITIPSSVSYIGWKTFNECTNLKEIKILGEYTSTGSFGEGDDAWFWTGLAEKNCVIKVKHENVKTLIESAGYTGTIIVDTNLS